jgi:steroid delta-isomerase-like uncharacterized protein
MPDNGKQVLLKYYERLNRHDLAGAAELLSEDCAVTVADSSLDREGYLDLFSSWLAGFPDLGNTVDEVIADGGTVAVRSTWEGTHDGGFVGIPPTGRRVRYGSFSFSRVEAGRITQRHLLANLFGVLQQIGDLSFRMPPAGRESAPEAPETARDLAKGVADAFRAMPATE